MAIKKKTTTKKAVTKATEKKVQSKIKRPVRKPTSKSKKKSKAFEKAPARPVKKTVRKKLVPLAKRKQKPRLASILSAINEQLRNDGHPTVSKGAMKSFYDPRSVQGFLAGVADRLVPQSNKLHLGKQLGSQVLGGTVADAKHAFLQSEDKLAAVVRAIDQQLENDHNPTAPDGAMKNFYNAQSIMGFFGGVAAILKTQRYIFHFGEDLGIEVLKGTVAEASYPINDKTQPAGGSP